MINRRVGRIHRRLRQSARLTQKSVSRKARVGRRKIGLLEADALGRLRFDDVERCLAVLGAELEVRVIYRGAEADRLIDRVHSMIVGRAVAVLRGFGWEARTEVSFSEWGERGSYDILAWHEPSETLLVTEVKSELVTVEGTLRPLDVKLRLAASIARQRFGWQARAVGEVLVLPEDRTARRQVTAAAAVLRAALPNTSRDIRSWLRDPSGAITGIWFISGNDGRPWPRNPSAVKRVRSSAQPVLSRRMRAPAGRAP
jgi:hypothetical protein